MNKSENKKENFQNIADEYDKYLKDVEKQNSNYREELPDENCKKIYDVIFLEIKKSRRTILRRKKIIELTETEMSPPT